MVLESSWILFFSEQSSVKISVEQFYYVYKISEYIVFVAFTIFGILYLNHCQ